MSLQKDIVYNENNGIRGKLDLYMPDEPKDNLPLLIFFHGGGIENGSKNGVSAIGRELNEKDIAFAAPNYRMYNQKEACETGKYPEFICDAAEAVAWCCNNVKNCKDIYIGGESAGAYLSMMLCFDRHYLKDAGVEPERISGYIHGSAQPTTHFNVLRERGIDTRRVIIDEASPIFHVSGGSGAPMMIITSDNDMENRLEQNQLLASTLKHFRYKAEVDYRVLAGKHCEFCYRRVKASDGTDGGLEIVGIAEEFIHKHSEF